MLTSCRTLSTTYTLMLFKNYFHVTMSWLFVTGSDKKGLIAHDKKFIFCHKHKNTPIHCQNELVLNGLFLLAAFSWPVGNPCEGSRSLMELWWAVRGLCVTVKLCHVGWRLLLSLTYHLASYEPCMASNLACFTPSPSPTFYNVPHAHHPASTTHPSWSSPDIIISGPSSEKNFLKWWET